MPFSGLLLMVGISKSASSGSVPALCWRSHLLPYRRAHLAPLAPSPVECVTVDAWSLAF